MAQQHPPQPIAQREFAEQLGIAPEALKKMRADLELMPGQDWLPGSPVRFTESGVKKVRAALKLPETVSAAPTQATSSADISTEQKEASAKKTGATERVELVVLQVARGTKRLVWCRAADGRQVRLRVRSNEKFMPGMRVPRCVRSRIDATLYDFEGRLPRWRGRF